MCNGCWSTRGRSAPSEEDDENEIANAIEAARANGISAAFEPEAEAVEPAANACDW